MLKRFTQFILINKEIDVKNLICGLLCVCLLAATAAAGTPTQYYVDPGAGNDTTGDGSIGTPWATVQHALDTITKDTTNGDQINVKAGTDDVLSSSLSFATYGGGSTNTPFIIRGYTTTANDGGIGGISGDNACAVTTASVSTANYVAWIDMHLHSSGANNVVYTGTYNRFHRCEINGSTGAECVKLGSNNLVSGCYIHGFTGTGIYMGGTSHTLATYVDLSDGPGQIGIAIRANSQTVARNIVYAGASSANGIDMFNSSHIVVMSNSLLGVGATGSAIYDNDGRGSYYINNLVEGWSGADSYGIRLSATATVDTPFRLANAVHNCTTPFAVFDHVIIDGDNETLASTPFAKSGELTFASRMTYFAPLDVGNVWGGGYPAGSNLDKGAVQHAASGSSSSVGRSYILSGNLNGELRFVSQDASVASQ